MVVAFPGGGVVVDDGVVLLGSAVVEFVTVTGNVDKFKLALDVSKRKSDNPMREHNT